MWSRTIISLVLLAATVTAQITGSSTGQTFTVVNGQIYTPGLAIVDAPQPFTPLGGDFLQLALDVSGDGKLGLPPYSSSAATGFYNLTAFLYSYDTGLNLTISNGTSSGWLTGCDNVLGPSGTPVAGCWPIMLQEPTSTVKHINFVWPDCLVGDGMTTGQGSARGMYNISVQQNFRLNGTDYFTVFDLPISVTNSIPSSTTSRAGGRLSCAALNNPLLSPDMVRASVRTIGWQPWLTRPSTTTSQQGVETVVTAVVTSVVATATTTVIAGVGSQGTGLVPGAYNGNGDRSQGYIGAATTLTSTFAGILATSISTVLSLLVLVL